MLWKRSGSALEALAHVEYSDIQVLVEYLHEEYTNDTSLYLDDHPAHYIDRM